MGMCVGVMGVVLLEKKNSYVCVCVCEQEQ